MLIDKMEQSEFLGCEFLTWLYWRVARHNKGGFCSGLLDVVEIPDAAEEYVPIGCRGIIVGFERAVTLDDVLAKEKVVVTEKDPAQSSEVRHALRQGKVVSQARLALKWMPKREEEAEAEWREFACVVKGRTLALSGVDLPSALDGGPQAERYEDQIILEKLTLMAELDQLVLGLYRTFLAERTDEAEWRPTLYLIRQWVSGEEPDLGHTLSDLAGPGGSVTISSGSRSVTLKGRDT